MKYVDEFRDGAKAETLFHALPHLLDNISPAHKRPLQIMEVCGGHTHAIFKYGIEPRLPRAIELVHGPGCPVCVLPRGRVDDCIAIAEQPGVILATFGDAMRVPGSRMNLLEAKAHGADVRTVYSPLDALRLARVYPDREVVFFALGFETTMPATAFTVLQAAREDIRNFSLLCHHITVIPTLKALLDDPGLRLDGFIGPGHVSAVIGARPYEFIARDYHRPLVIAGFEPLDILHAIYMVVRQISEGRCEIENQYQRIVPSDGNRQALDAVDEVFETRERCVWRGLGNIEHSGVRVRAVYARYDAERKFSLPSVDIVDPHEVQCGNVLKGQIKPWQCAAFGTTCTPAHPAGALMVSSEGACAAHYHYGGARQ